LHDPALVARRQRRIATNGQARHRRLTHLPDGYLRKLTNRTAVGHAMDRLYREVRLGLVTTEMGSVLFAILTRLMDSGLLESRGDGPAPSRRSKADRLRPKLSELLTRAERAAWQKAIANLPDSGRERFALHQPPAVIAETVGANGPRQQDAIERPVKVALQVAS
jgi:hypothetical protein